MSIQTFERKVPVVQYQATNGSVTVPANAEMVSFYTTGGNASFTHEGQTITLFDGVPLTLPNMSDIYGEIVITAPAGVTVTAIRIG